MLFSYKSVSPNCTVSLTLNSRRSPKKVPGRFGTESSANPVKKIKSPPSFPHKTAYLFILRLTIHTDAVLNDAQPTTPVANHDSCRHSRSDLRSGKGKSISSMFAEDEGHADMSERRRRAIGIKPPPPPAFSHRAEATGYWEGGCWPSRPLQL